MKRVHFLLKKALTPITIMVIPHENLKSINVKVPSLAIFLVLLLSLAGSYYVLTLAANGLQYPSLVKQLEFYSDQFSQWNATVSGLREVEEDFRRIFSVKSREKVLEKMDAPYSGSVDIEGLMKDLQRAAENVGEIKDYLRNQKDIYVATPRGLPVEGNVSSPYGKRESPFDRTVLSFHSGMDLSAARGTPIHATADGLVSFSGPSNNSGNVVVLSHGFGYSTIYAHNKKNGVKVGQRVKRGEIIATVGSTGKSTGPHVHYEVWEKGKSVNPRKFLQGRS